MVRKTKNKMYCSDDDDFYGNGVHIHGGALAGNEIRGLLDASYDKTVKDVDGGWVKDEDLSTGKSKVFYNPETGKILIDSIPVEIREDYKDISFTLEK